MARRAIEPDPEAFVFDGSAAGAGDVERSSSSSPGLGTERSVFMDDTVPFPSRFELDRAMLEPMELNLFRRGSGAVCDANEKTSAGERRNGR